MKKISGVLFGLSLFGAGALLASVNRPIGVFDSGTGERTALFNGRDLSGWTSVVDHDATGGYSACEPTWFVTNGTIRTTGTPFGHLRTKRDDFGDFRLHVEYRWWRKTENPNSGTIALQA